ncbi:hypothetical protein [Blastococcus sp. SYSU D01042]
MSAAPQNPHDDEPARPTGRSTESGRRRARVLIPLIFVGAILLVFLFIFLVSRLNQ